MKKLLRVQFDGTMINNFTNGIGNDALQTRSVLADRFAEIGTLRFEDQPKISGMTIKINGSRRISNLKLLIFGSLEVLKDSTDLFFQAQANSLAAPHATKTFTRIHDIFPITNPEWFPHISALYFKKCFKKLSKDNIFLCNSESTKEALRKYLGKSNAAIEVLYCAISSTHNDCCNNCEGCSLNNVKEYGIAIGTVEPRKDYGTLLAAWKHKTLTETGVSLVVVGKYGWKQKKIARKMKSSQNSRIHWVSNACDGSVAKLRSKAKFFVSSSLNEGFNIAAAEACNDGLQLILSDIPVHRETHPEAIFFIPGNAIELVKAVKDVLQLGIMKLPQPAHLPYVVTRFSYDLNQILDKYGF
jgi:glycosyltransferase involved in cell wall biosynthesis